jgi:hypothetical protein
MAVAWAVGIEVVSFGSFGSGVGKLSTRARGDSVVGGDGGTTTGQISLPDILTVVCWSSIRVRRRRKIMELLWQKRGCF